MSENLSPPESHSPCNRPGVPALISPEANRPSRNCSGVPARTRRATNGLATIWATGWRATHWRATGWRATSDWLVIRWLSTGWRATGWRSPLREQRDVGRTLRNPPPPPPTGQGTCTQIFRVAFAPVLAGGGTALVALLFAGCAASPRPVATATATATASAMTTPTVAVTPAATTSSTVAVSFTAPATVTPTVIVAATPTVAVAPPPPTPTAEGALQFNVSELPLGLVPQGATVPVKFTLTNPTTAPLRVTGMDESCRCLSFQAAPAEIAPQETGVFEWMFNSSRDNGWASQVVTVEFSNGRQVVGRFTAWVEPPVGVVASPDQLVATFAPSATTTTVALALTGRREVLAGATLEVSAGGSVLAASEPQTVAGFPALRKIDYQLRVPRPAAAPAQRPVVRWENGARRLEIPMELGE